MTLISITSHANQGIAAEEQSITKIAELTYKGSKNEIVRIGLMANRPITSLQYMCKNTDLAWASFNEDKTKFFTRDLSSVCSMFEGCQKLEGLDLRGIDTSNVTNMENMFKLCSKLRTLDLSGFNTSSVTNMKCMFAYCLNLEKLDISNFDMSKIISAENMFFNCKNLKSLKLPKSEQQSPKLKKEDFTGCDKLCEITYAD